MTRIKAANKGQAMRKFIVSEGFRIGDPNAKRPSNKPLTGGDEIMLTREQAKHYMEMGAITLELPEFDDGDDDDEGDDDDASDTQQPSPIATSIDSNKTENGSGNKAEGEGNASDGAVGSETSDEAEGENTPRRRRSKNL